MTTVDEMLAKLWSHHQRGNVTGAEAGYRELVRKAPRNANALVYHGIALFDLRRYDEAVDVYRRALELRPQFPVCWNNLGNALRMLGQIDEADAAFQRAIDQDPRYANAYKNRGTLWIWTGEIDRGLQWYEEALRLAPDDAELHRNLGVIFLLQGRYEEGWREYRWRWRMPGMPRPAIPAPLWEGQDPRGKTIFVYPEQGLGDTIQFARMIPALVARGAAVVLGCEPRLVPLMSGVAGTTRIVPLGGELGRVDFHASLVEVTDHLWQGPEAITGEAYLSVPDNLVDYWRRQLSPLPGRRVGICWQGNPDHHADHYRSVPLEALRPLATAANVTLISLQHGHGSDQLQQVDFSHRIVRLPPDLDKSGGAFLDTAAIMRNLDLVITTDTSAGHLAGALGVPTWLLLPKVPDWRWGLSGETTPWYHHHRLWRQQNVEDWAPVVQRMAEELA